MNAKERVFARLEGKRVDRVPNLNMLTQFVSRNIGVAYSKYISDYKFHAKGNLDFAEKFGIDCVTVMSDPTREAADFGSNVIYPMDDVPHVLQPLISLNSQLSTLKAKPPESGKKMSQAIELTQYFKSAVGNQFPIIGWVQGSFAQAATLMGTGNFIHSFSVDSIFVKELLDICLEQAKLFAKAQIQAGADIIGIGDSIFSVMGHIVHEECTVYYMSELLKSIKLMGAKTKLHPYTCITPFVGKLPMEYIDILDADWTLPLDKVYQLNSDLAVSGNYNQIELMLQGDRTGIREAVKSCAMKGNQCYMSSAGCEVPKYTPPENLLAVKEALTELSI